MVNIRVVFPNIHRFVKIPEIIIYTPTRYYIEHLHLSFQDYTSEYYY